jgi:hypothetical protein
MALLVLGTHQIPMLFDTALMNACSPGIVILLNGQMAQLNPNGMAQGTLLVAACWWILKMDCPFSSREMAF